MAGKQKKPVGTMNIILVIVAVSLLVFTGLMIRTFYIYGAIPDTLCTCVFGVLGTECGAMAWIKTTKERNKEREWQKSDEAEAKAELKALQEERESEE